MKTVTLILHTGHSWHQTIKLRLFSETNMYSHHQTYILILTDEKINNECIMQNKENEDYNSKFEV